MSGMIQSLINGIVIGVVTDLTDPSGLARVKVSYPCLNNEQSNWARLVTLMAGNNRGSLFRPEIGDEVIVAFERGNPDQPFVLGALWNGKDLPPATGSPDEDNNWRLIRSRSGHVFKFDDTDGKEAIDLVDKDEKRRFAIQCSEKKLQVLAEDMGDVIEIKAPSGTLLIETKDKIDVTCTAGDITVKAEIGAVKIEALSVEVKASTSMKLDAGTTMDIQAGATMSLKAPMINLN